MRFSLVTSYYIDNELRKRQLERFVRSVLNQSFTDFELILYDDGSPKGEELDFPDDGRLVYLNGPHLERVIALNRGIEKTRGEWLYLVDADDELFSYSLEVLDKIIKEYPKHKVFNFGSLHVWSDYGTQIRGPFEPERGDVGHVVFGGGNICSGTFIFKRECVEEHGAFPKEGKMWNPWDFSMDAQKEFPEIKEFFTHKHPDHPKGVPRELGNPWGQDFYMFYKLTRNYHSKPFNIPLYIVHHEKKEREIKTD